MPKLQEPITREWLFSQLSSGITQKEIAKNAAVHVGTIEKYVRKYDLTNFKERFFYKPVLDRLVLNDLAFAYTLGLFVTDGNYDKTTGRVSIGIKDEYPIRYLGDYFSVPVYHSSSSGKGLYILSFPSALASQVFPSIGVYPGVKTHTAKLPDLEGESLRLAIRGMVDGDGSIAKSRQTYSLKFFSCSHYLIDVYTDYLAYNGWKYSSHKHKNGIQVELSSKLSLEACVHIYGGYPNLVIPRKLSIIQNQVDDIVRTYEMINRKSMELNASWITN